MTWPGTPQSFEYGAAQVNAEESSSSKFFFQNSCLFRLGMENDDSFRLFGKSWWPSFDLFFHEKSQVCFDICYVSTYSFEYSFGVEVYGVLPTKSEHESNYE